MDGSQLMFRQVVSDDNFLSFSIEMAFSASEVFKVPQLSVQKEDTSYSSIPRFKWADLLSKQELNRGGFGVVYKCLYSGKFKQEEEVVVKKLLGGDCKCLFWKEARILFKLEHPNIVSFRSFCSSPYSIMMEYLYFDFLPFDSSKNSRRVSNVNELLDAFDRYELVGFENIPVTIANQVACGLKCLHELKIAHRDLKPGNILVSNQHYCSETNAKVRQELWNSKPIVCKITDFGESRAEKIRTNHFFQMDTQRTDRGTRLYMAPELFCKNQLLKSASIDDLIAADIWSYGMVLFRLLNPDLPTLITKKFKWPKVYLLLKLLKIIWPILNDPNGVKNTSIYKIEFPVASLIYMSCVLILNIRRDPVWTLCAGSWIKKENFSVNTFTSI